MTLVFFFSDDCRLCPSVASEVADLLHKHGYSAIFRKPSLQEIGSVAGFAFPALLIPRGFFNLSSDTLLVGSGIPGTLKRFLDEQRN